MCAAILDDRHIRHGDSRVVYYPVTVTPAFNSTTAATDTPMPPIRPVNKTYMISCISAAVMSMGIGSVDKTPPSRTHSSSRRGNRKFKGYMRNRKR